MLTTLRVNRPGLLDRGVETCAELDALLTAGAPVAIAVSGGKDSIAAAIATCEHLNAIGHTGPRVLIHSDLGRVEWRDSLPTCERLAARLGLELIVCRRAAGDMMDRWLTRWQNNVARYAELECVKIILPWSTPSMRFCTSELKSAVMASALVKRFPGQRIISACGVRREESRERSKAPTTKENARLTNSARKTTGLDWNPIAAWTESDVYAFCAAREFQMHEGYTKFGMSRISCAFCIMGKASDLAASATCPDNADIYREMVELELASSFAFQGSRWLADVAPHLLTEGQRNRVTIAKQIAARRETIEAQIPDHLLYEKGWPKIMPTEAEAQMLCGVRREIAALLGLTIKYTEPVALLARYAELMTEKRAKEEAAEKKAARRAARSAS